ncbi:MAG: hypothetical protein ACKOJE_06185, partial [Bacteroidota bacterium]
PDHHSAFHAYKIREDSPLKACIRFIFTKNAGSYRNYIFLVTEQPFKMILINFIQVLAGFSEKLWF